LKGLSLFNCRSWHGAFDYVGIRLKASESNFTGMTAAAPGATSGGMAAVFYENYRSVLEGIFLHTAGSESGLGCLNIWSGNAPSLEQCSFVSNSIGAIVHNSAAHTSLIRCYFEGTTFTGGWVKVDGCFGRRG
jgi:hypothetical protein